MHFDARAAKLLQPGQHLVVDGCPGLRLEVSATRKTWTYRYKLGERMKQAAIGQWPAMPVQAAVAQWQAMRGQREAGVDVGKQRRLTREIEVRKARPYTVAKLVQDYIVGHLEESRKEAGALAARRALEGLLEEHPDFASQAPGDVTRGVAFEILESRKATPTAAVKLRSMLGSAWDHALDAGRIDGDTPNWWRQVMQGKLKSKGKIIGGEHQGKKRRTLTDKEVATLLRWLPNMHDLGRDATVMYLWTCARGVEIMGMRPEQIAQESDGWWLTVPKDETKNARFDDAVDHRVPLIGRALEVVQRRMENLGKSGYLFEDARGEQYTQHFFSTYIYSLQPYSEKARRRQGEGLVLAVTDWTPHNLRRTGRTMLSSLGCVNEIGEAILGHMPETIVGTYNANTYDKERRQWLAKLAKHLEALAR